MANEEVVVVEEDAGAFALVAIDAVAVLEPGYEGAVFAINSIDEALVLLDAPDTVVYEPY